MDKYTILILLNLPFVLFGLLKAVVFYKEGVYGRLAFAIRVVFWLIIILGLFFAQDIYTYLVSQNLTDSAPISLADVVLVTGINLCLFLSIRLYSRVEQLEAKLFEMQEKLSIELSKKNKR